MRQFADLIRHAHDRSHVSIDNAKLISTGLLALIAATVILASTFLFSPLLKKLRNEHRQTMAFEKRLTLLAHTDALTGLNNRSSLQPGPRQSLRRAGAQRRRLLHAACRPRPLQEHQ
ncbi:hypothetical protein [Sinorhizobium fredii]|uniref:hypothetical protein n=1 Tax=Rhizobium fredii TaxID=380 RepID=UPI0026D711C8